MVRVSYREGFCSISLILTSADLAFHGDDVSITTIFTYNSSYDAGEQRADSNRYSEMLNICYQMITLAAGSREHTQDAKAKLYGMIDLYRANQEPPSMTQIGSNVGCTRGDTTTVGGSGQVRSPNVVRGKG